MVVLFSIVAVVLSLLLVVGIHESGHALVAYLFKVKINKISIGFGKALFSWQSKNGIQWIWARWPIGGFVELLNTRIEPVAPGNKKWSFDKKPIWIRCLILLSGALANIFTAWIALVLMLAMGYQQMVPVIATIKAPSIAHTAGLLAGDRIKEVAGKSVATWQDVGMQLIMGLGYKGLDLVVENETGIKHQVQLDLTQWRSNQGNDSLLIAIGVTPDLSLENKHQVTGLPWNMACQQAFEQVIGLLHFFVVMLKQFLTGVIPFGFLLGPLGFFSVMVGSFLQGLAVFLYFIASLSLSVALINLLPVPGLDGGSIVYALVEKIRGRPVSVGIEILLHRLVFIAFCLILVQLLLNDVQRYLH